MAATVQVPRPQRFPSSGWLEIAAAFGRIFEEFQDFADVASEQAWGEHVAGKTPTSDAILRGWPGFRVTESDAEQLRCTECVICLSALSVGQDALRLPCSHAFHSSCAREWLNSSNQCPVCRYELPTDNVEFEKGRCMRMAVRKLHLSLQSLQARRIRELKHLAQHLGVSTTSCSGKAELVTAIRASQFVRIIDDSAQNEISQGQFISSHATSRALPNEDVEPSCLVVHSPRSRMVLFGCGASKKMCCDNTDADRTAGDGDGIVDRDEEFLDRQYRHSRQHTG